MRSISDEIPPIDLELELMTTPTAVQRALTSQTELRKWWAPRVIMSRNIVSQEEGIDMEMRLVFEDKNHLIRYQWRGKSWPDDEPSTIITVQIDDLGVSRGSTGEGLLISISHDGWVSQEKRDHQAAIWEKAAENLRSLLEGKPFEPWWEGSISKDDFRKIRPDDFVLFIERMEQENRGKKEKKEAARRFEKIFKNLESAGDWYIKKNFSEVEFRHDGKRLFGLMKNAHMVLPWREIDGLLGRSMQDFGDRLALELDMDLHVGKTHDRIPAVDVNPDIWSRWCGEVIAHYQGNK